jgi:hypothetical protein
MTDRPNIAMRLVPVELLFGHRSTPSLNQANFF